MVTTFRSKASRLADAPPRMERPSPPDPSQPDSSQSDSSQSDSWRAVAGNEILFAFARCLPAVYPIHAPQPLPSRLADLLAQLSACESVADATAAPAAVSREVRGTVDVGD